MADCPLCGSAVGELSCMPALLSQLDRDELAAIDDRSGADPLLPDELLRSVLAKVSWRRRRSGIVTWTAGAAAAAVLAIGVLVGAAGHSPTSVPTPPQASVAVSADRAGRDEHAGLDGLAEQPAVGNVHLDELRLPGPAERHHDTLAMVVVGRDGSHTRMATWVANPCHTATPTSSISTPVEQIASVQVVSADDGQVLLERSL